MHSPRRFLLDLRARALVLALALPASANLACGPGNVPADAAPDVTRDASSDVVARCNVDRECSDGVFCNGAEVCAPSDPAADARGCVAPSQTACRATQTCDESGGRCVTDCNVNADADGDGHRAQSCGGDDCDDADVNRAPGRVEVCDARGHDEDCDTSTFGTRDNDGDGFVDAVCCNADSSGARHCGTDCNDMNAMIRPSAQETCNGLDDNCNGMTDEGLRRTFHPDADGDRFGSNAPGTGVDDCTAPPGYVDNATDCNDAVPAQNPGAPEVCDGVDNDCDGMTDEQLAVILHRDSDGDLFGSTASADAMSACGPVTGYVTNATDCDDTVAAVHPGGAEVCDGLDNDCNGMTDEGVAQSFYRDADGDGFGDSAMVRLACASPAGYTDRGGDCDDTTTSANPLALETCNGRDDNCNGITDESPAAGSCSSIHATSTCDLGHCKVVVCDTGFQDCNRDVTDACETDVTSAVNNCGTCGTQCGLGGVCTHGACDHVVTLALGEQHACALRSSGAIVCWGSNAHGEHGDPTVAATATAPSIVAGISDAVQIGAGENFSCARHATGAVSCWGSAVFGELGSTPGADQPLPVRVPGIYDAVDLAVGRTFACVARRTGEVSCWGQNDRGQLGTGDTTDSFYPRPVQTITRAQQVRAGDRHTCAVTWDGMAFCWGDNTSGQLGTTADTSPHPMPAGFFAVPTTVEITAGARHTCARDSSGGVFCVGDNSRGQLGATPGTTPPASSPVPGNTGSWVSIRAGGDANVAVDVRGSLYVWGDNTNGELGDPTIVGATGTPQALSVPPGAANAIDGAIRGTFGCAVTANGQVYCWGQNGNGELGDGGTTAHATPTRVAGV